MSKEKDARDLALKEYDEFMNKYKAEVEAGNPKLMQHMLKLEADKIRTQGILDSVEKSSAVLDGNVYGDTKMKLQMSKEEYHIDQSSTNTHTNPKQLDEKEQAFVNMATKPITIGNPDEMDSYRFDASDFGQIDETPRPKKEVKKEEPKEQSGIVIDPETGKKTYNGPKLRSRKVVKGKEWNESHPNFHDKGVGGM